MNKSQPPTGYTHHRVSVNYLNEETDDDEDDGEPEEDEAESEETDSNDEDSESDECEETEEQFLERYAKAAAALEDDSEVIEEAEEEDDEREIDLGSLNEIDPEKLVLSLMEKHHQKVVQLVPYEVISTFLSAFPAYTGFFS